MDFESNNLYLKTLYLSIGIRLYFLTVFDVKYQFNAYLGIL